MVALQPSFLACPTPTLRARAHQLAILLSTGGPPPAVLASARGVAKARTLPETRNTAGGPAQSGLERTERSTSASAAANPPSLVAAPAALSPAASRSSNLSGRRSGEGDARGALPNGLAATVTEQAAMALIARQPALLRAPLDRLVARCVELADVLGVTPYDACMCLTRTRPEELVRMLQAPQAVVREAWLGLVTALAAVEQPGLYEALIPAAPKGPGGASDESGGQSAGRVGAGSGAGRLKVNVWSRRSRLPAVFPPGAERAARQAALLCPQLLMLQPDWLHASALHLHASLGLSPPGLVRLLCRSPRLLLLPKRHREDTLQALEERLALRGPQHAARLVVQQPNLLKWTPEALDGKLRDMAAVLELSHAGVARLCRNQPALLAMSACSLASKLRALQGLLRLSDADAARRLALRQPGLLSMSTATLGRKVRLLAQGLGLTSAVMSAAASEAASSVPLGRKAGGTAAVAVGVRVQRGSVLQTVLRLVVAEPTLLTMSVAALPQRLEQLAEALGGATLHEARAVVLACPRLLLVQRAALRHRLKELAFGLDAPAWAIGRLVLARPSVFFAPLPELRAAVARLEAAGAGAGMRGGRRGAAVLEALAQQLAVEEDVGGRVDEAAGRPSL